MSRNGEYVLIPRSELEKEKRESAQAAAQAVIEELRPEISRLRDQLRRAVMATAQDTDLIPEPVLMDYIGIESRQTLQNWGIVPDERKGNSRFYEWASVEEVIRSEG